MKRGIEYYKTKTSGKCDVEIDYNNEKIYNIHSISGRAEYKARIFSEAIIQFKEIIRLNPGAWELQSTKSKKIIG